MRVRNINPAHLKTLENAFRVLKEVHTSKSGANLIADTLHECFGDTFVVSVVPSAPDDKMFVMSIFPDRSTVDKIIEAVTSGKSNFATIQSLWEKNTRWTIEIDEAILGTETEGPTPRELVAILLHELGHVVESKSVTSRVVTILQYEYAQTKMQNKLLLRDKIFRSIMSLPILNACVADQKGKDVKHEIKADTFVRKLGYTKELVSVMNRLLKDSRYPMDDGDEAMKTTAKFSLNTVQNLRERKEDLIKKQMTTMQNHIRSPYMESVLVDIYGQWFVDESTASNLSRANRIVLEDRKQKFIHSYMESTETQYMKEFGIFGRKKLEKIDQYDLDFISIKADSIESDTDKMMLISYIHNKLDTVQFYLDILDDAEQQKRYKVPHSRGYLEQVKKQLLLLRERVLKTRIPAPKPDLYVGYPAGYEG